MHQDTQRKQRNTSTTSGRRSMLAAVLIAAAGALTIAGSSVAADAHGGGLHGRGDRMAAVDPATADKHIDKMVERIAGDGTPQQKARLAEIAKSAFADLQPLQAQTRAAHQRAHQLLMQTSIDRVALEQIRVEQVQRYDASSKRLLAALADASEVLTPEQRGRFAEHLKRLH